MNLLNRIRNSIEMCFRCYNADGGAGGGAGGGDAGEVKDLLARAPINIPDGLEDDPDILDAIRDANMAGGSDDDEGDKGGAGDKSGGDDAKMGDGAGDEGGSDDNKSGEDDTDVKYTFEEDLTVGDVMFTKDALNELPTPVLANLGKMKQHIDSLSEKVRNADSRSEELLKDPVIKERVSAIRDGRANDPYGTGMTKESHAAIKDALLKLDLGEDEVDTFLKDVLVKEFNQDLEFSTANAVKNRVGEIERTNTLTQNRTKAFGVLRDALQFNSDFKVDEQDISKFFSIDDRGRVTGFNRSHPEYEKFSSGAQKIFDYWANRRKSSWADFAQLSSKEVYAAAAAFYNMPVAINTADRDTKIRQSERDNIIQSLGGKRAADVMSKDGKASTSKDGDVHASIDNTGAIDDKKLDDPEYVDNLLNSAETDEELMETHRMLRGRVINRT
jgi:hypothetical protein